MKKILLLALPLMVMCFASCEKDNGKDDDGKPVQKLVKSIYTDEEDFTTSFEYDKNGRIIRTTRTWIRHDRNLWRITDIAYKDNMIIETITEDGDYMCAIVHHLDDNGYVIKTETKSKPDAPTTLGEVTYEYENGKLVKMEGEPDGSPDGRTYQWQGNDIITTYWVDHDYRCNFKYSNIVDNFNVDIAVLLAPRFYGISAGSERDGVSMIKFKGTTSEHLFNQLEEEDVWFSYELDSDGYVKTINMDESGGGEYVPWYHIEYVE